MLHEALEAFVRSDDEAAHRVLQSDDVVDLHHASILSTVTMRMSSNPQEIQAGLHAIRVAKYLERIADHATNVAEEVIFIVRGDDLRHGRWRTDRE